MDIYFEKIIDFPNNEFKKEMENIDSEDLIKYLKNCSNKSIKNEYYKKIKNIFGKDYLKILKTAVNYKKPIYDNIKMNLFIFNIVISSILCSVIFISIELLIIYSEITFIDFVSFIFTGTFEILFLGFLIAILPQIILMMIFKYLNKIFRVNIGIKILMTIILGFSISLLFYSTFTRGTISLNNYFTLGYPFYISAIVSGLIFQIFQIKIDIFIKNKIKLNKSSNVA